MALFTLKSKKAKTALDDSPADSHANSQEQRDEEEKKGIKKLIALLLLLVAVTIAAVMYLPVFFEDDGAGSQEVEKSELTKYAERVSDNIGLSLLANQLSLKSLSETPEILSLFDQYNADEAEEIAKKKLNTLPDAIKLSLIPNTPGQVLTIETYPLTFASIEMIKEAINSTEQVKAEWHFPGQDDEHIALVQRVHNLEDGLTGGKVTGVLHLSMAVDPVKMALLQSAQQPQIRSELKQNINSGDSVLLHAAGHQSEPGDNPTVMTPVTGTRWFVIATQYTAPVIKSDNIQPFLLPGLSVILSGILFWLWKRKSRVSTSSAAEANNRRARIITPGERQEIKKEKALETSPADKRSDELDVDDALLHSDRIIVEELEEEPDDELELDAEFDDIEEIEEFEENNDMGNDNMNEAANAPASIFRAYDIRGIVGETLTEKIVYNIGKALGSEAYTRGDNTVVVGRDGRLSSPSLSEALINGLTESGRDVIDIGMVPTPALYFATNLFDTSSGIMITGSHNPPNYNGIKMVLAGTTLADEAIQALRQRILDNDYTEGESGESQTAEIGSEYIRRITEDIPVALSNSFKVVVDSGNGVAGVLGPQLLRALGHDVIELYCDIDGNFPNHHPDPSQPENLHELIETVKSEGADLGLAFDGDGDRLGVVDRDGNIIWPDRQMMLFAQDVISRNPGGEIIFDVKCSNHLRRVIEEAGGKATMWKTGHSLIKAKMKETGALLAGEMSGHVFFKERWYGFDDGLYTAARLLEILTKAEQPPHEILGNLPGGVATPELRLDLHEDQHAPFMATLAELANFGEGKVGTIDGIRVDFPDGWGLIRPSNTTPCLVMRFEADNEEALEKVQTLFREQLLAMDSSLKLPF